jgi:hypothetical protein
MCSSQVSVTPMDPHKSESDQACLSLTEESDWGEESQCTLRSEEFS